MNSIQTSNQKIFLLVIPLLIILLYIRSPGAFYNPQLWAEDANVFLADAKDNKLTSLIKPYAGYQLIILRIAASITTFFNLLYAPDIFMILSFLLLFFAAFIIFIAFEELCVKLRVFLCLSIVALPHGGEVFFTLTNCQWILGASLIALASSYYIAHRNPGRLWSGLVLLLALTGPFSIILIPFIIFRIWILRDFPQAKWFYIPVVIGGLVQLFYLLSSSRDIVGTGELGSLREWGIAIFINFLKPFKVGGLLLLMVFLMYILLYVLYRWVSKLIKNSEKKKYYTAFMLFIVFACCYSLTLFVKDSWLVNGIFIVYVFYLFYVHVRDSLKNCKKEKCLRVILLLLASMVIMAVGLYIYKHNPSILHPFGNGQRYFYIPYFLLIISLVYMSKGKYVVLTLIVLSISFVYSFTTVSHRNLNWSSYVLLSKYFDEIIVPINPIKHVYPGWHYKIKNDHTESLPFSQTIKIDSKMLIHAKMIGINSNDILATGKNPKIIFKISDNFNKYDHIALKVDYWNKNRGFFRVYYSSNDRFKKELSQSIYQNQGGNLVFFAFKNNQGIKRLRIDPVFSRSPIVFREVVVLGY